MSPAARLKLLVSPSISSGVLCGLIGLLVPSVAAWSYISQNLLFYDYLFGRDGLTTIFLNATDSLSPLKVTLARSTITYHVMVCVVALMAGAIVYIVLQTIGKVAGNIKALLRDARSTSKAARTELRITLVRSGLSIVSIAAWVIYTIIFLDLIVPAAISMLRLGIGTPTGNGPHNSLIIIGSVLLLAASLHVHVVFARLCLLRVRLFGSQDIEIAESRR